MERLDTVLEKLRLAGLRLRKDKCEFMAQSVKYLGYKIDAEGIHPTEEKVQAILKANRPQGPAELKAYLGMLTYYSKFLKNRATVLAPLYRLLSKGTPWKWTSDHNKAFQESKELLTTAPVLTHYNPKLPLIVACDASPQGVGAVLSHKLENGDERPVAFASRSLSKAERNYSQIDREGLAIQFGVKRFHRYIYGRHFMLISDHKPLLGLFGEDRQIPPMASARVQRWALQLAAYEYTFQYKPGSMNANADALSRLPLPGTPETDSCT